MPNFTSLPLLIDHTTSNQFCEMADPLNNSCNSMRRPDKSLLAEMLLNHGPDAVVVTSMEGLVVHFNSRAELLFGYQESEILFRSVEILLPDHLREGHVALRQGYTSAPTLRQMGDARIVTGQHKSGHELPITISLAPFATNQDRWVLCVVRDAAALVQVQLRRHQQEKLESIGRLAGGIAHDINNQLTVILGYTEYLLTLGEFSESVKSQLVEIERAGNRCVRTVQQVLSYSRKQLLQSTIVDPNALCASMVDMLSRMVGDDINLAFVPHRGIGCIKADPTGLENALVNLVLNARDAMPDGGHIVIESSLTHLDECTTFSNRVKPGHYVVLTLTDTGCGMDQATVAQMFEPFFTTKDGKGTGLGLASVYGFMKQSDGYITGFSEPDHGSVFKLYFPQVSETEVTRPSPGATTVLHRGTETILLVEDNIAVKQMIEDVLCQCGYRVLSVSSGNAALQLVKRTTDHINLVVTDVLMPGMSGLSLIAELTMHLDEKRVLYLSGFGLETSKLGDELGWSTAFLQKPFSVSDLSAKVREMLNNSRPQVVLAN